MKKFFSALFLSVLLVQAAQALTIGTFNVEYFHIAGTGGSTMSHPAYTREDVRDIARSILRSGADVLAMQEIQGEETMRYLVLNELHGWKYYGKDIDFKYLDYYYSTGRKDIKVASSYEEAMQMEPLPLPDLSKLQQGLLDTFPYDLWNT